MDYTPIEKLRNRVLLIILMIPIASKFDAEKSIELLKSNFVWPLLLVSTLWSLRNYKIRVSENRIELFSMFRKAIEVEGKQINRIELESNKSGKWIWEMIYIYTKDSVYEFSITAFNQNKLINGLISFSASNNITIDTSNYNQKRFDII